MEATWWVTPDSFNHMHDVITGLFFFAFGLAGIGVALWSSSIRSGKAAAGGFLMLGVALLSLFIGGLKEIRQQDTVVQSAEASTANLDGVLRERYGAHFTSPQAVATTFTSTRPEQIDNVMLTVGTGTSTTCTLSTPADSAGVTAVCAGTELPRR